MKWVPLVVIKYPLMFAEKQIYKNKVIDFSAVFVVVSSDQLRNRLPPAVTNLLC
jgi:hypothetical protein